jgi:adenylyltransferase/sulfurtransferase
MTEGSGGTAMTAGNGGTPIPELAPRVVQERLAGPNPPLLLDVRELWEHGVAHLPGARLVPLATLPGAVAALDPASDLVVYCHHGVRSMHACHFLAQTGFTRVANLAGGIDAWSLTVDAAVPRY